MAPCIQNISLYLMKNGDKRLPWSSSTCLALLCYVTNFCTNLENYALCYKISRLDAIAAYGNETKIASYFVNAIIPLVRKFFQVPKLDQFSEMEKNLKPDEILAGFLHFLLQILNGEANDVSDGNQENALLHQELTFLLAILGDKPFQSTHVFEQELNNVLAEFELLASKTGSYMYSSIFSTNSQKATRFRADLTTLLKTFEFLKSDIKQYCIKFSERPFFVTSRSDVVDSFFIIHSLIEDLDYMTTHPFDSNLDDQIKTIHQELAFLETFLKDIGRDADKLKESLNAIRDLAYEVEYLINSHVTGMIPLWYLNPRLSSIIVKLRLTCERLQQIKKTSITRDTKGYGARTESSGPVKLPVLMDDILSSGFEDNMIRIMGDLVSKQKTSRQVIILHGMPGLGKTTMAGKLYNSRSVSTYFDRHAWCVVSQSYSVRELMIHILVSLSSQPIQEEFLKKREAELGVDIHKSLKQRRYLIVLDDIWDSSMWYNFERYFPDDGNRSRVILTSRIKDVAPSGSIIHTLPLLSEDECWELLEKKVFLGKSCPPCLLNIGNGIASKCSGVPLAVTVTAGILVHLEREESEWEIVEKQLDAFLLDSQSDYKKILELSYEHLPHNLRPCFLYLAAFPEDTEISVKKLFLWWIAEGFVRTEEGKTPEDTAKTYLLDLINRSLVMAVKRGYDGVIKTCRMHDLLRDFCVKKAYELNFLKSSKALAEAGDFAHSGIYSLYEKHQHLCIQSEKSVYWRPFGLNCRSFIGPLSQKSAYVQEMPVVKVMDVFPVGDKFYKPPIFERPIFRRPTNLRYLCVPLMLIGNGSNLVHLEFLCVTWDYVVPIPLLVILKLVKLRHLDIPHGVVFNQDCESSLQTTKLSCLSNVIICEQNDEEFFKYTPLLMELRFTFKYGSGAAFPDLCSLTKLESLHIEFIRPKRRKVDISTTISRIDFPKTIKVLSLRSGTLPWEMMSVIGTLPNLVGLKLLRQAFCGEMWDTKDDEFQKLEYLKIESCDIQKWNSCSEHFPSLKHLILKQCNHLLEIPSDLGNIATLQTIKTWYCSKGACLSAALIQEEQREYGNEKLQVIIIDV